MKMWMLLKMVQAAITWLMSAEPSIELNSTNPRPLITLYITF